MLPHHRPLRLPILALTADLDVAPTENGIPP